MFDEHVRSFIQKYIEMLPCDRSRLKLTESEAEEKAGDFLVATAHLMTWKHLYTNELIKARSMEKGTFAKVMAEKSSIKKITEIKILVEADSDYQKQREVVEKLENDTSYFKSMFDIFMNAHIFYRQLARGEPL